MSNIQKIIVASLLTFGVTNQAIAAKTIHASAPPPPPPSQAKPAATQPVAPAPVASTQAPSAAPAASNLGTYIGAQVGESMIGGLMGYRFSKMFAMEISYDYADPVYTPTTILKKYSIGASGLAMFPVKFSEMGPMAIYVKVGYGRFTEKYTVNNPGIPVPPATTTITTTTKTDVTGGAGVHVDLSSNTSARLGVNVVGNDRSTYLAAMYKF